MKKNYILGYVYFIWLFLYKKYSVNCKKGMFIYFYMYSFDWFLEEDSDLMFEIK